MTINKFINTGPYEFYGVFNNKFKLGKTVFEAIEDESDGYRSYLETIELTKPEGIYSKRPFALVNIKEYEDGIQLVSEDGHVWLKIFTDNSDDYYPSFIFAYIPDQNVKEFLPTNLCPREIYPENFI